MGEGKGGVVGPGKVGDFTLYTYLALTLEGSPEELNVTAAQRAVVRRAESRSGRLNEA